MSNLIYVEQLGIKHLEPYLEYLTDPEVGKTTQPYGDLVVNKDQIIEWLSTIASKPGRKDFAIIRGADHKFIGEVVLNEVVGLSANIRIGLKSEFFGMGYGYQAMQNAIDYGFEKMGLQTITLSVFIINERGLGLYKKLGFVETGRGVCEGFDEIYMQLSKP